MAKYLKSSKTIVKSLTSPMVHIRFLVPHLLSMEMIFAVVVVAFEYSSAEPDGVNDYQVVALQTLIIVNVLRL